MPEQMTRIVPPLEHEEHELHWLAVGQSYDVMEWTGDTWRCIGDAEPASPEHLAKLNFRYVGPAVPPEEHKSDG